MAKLYRKRKGNTQGIGDAIDRLLQVYGLEEGVDNVKITTIWDNLMGPWVARETRSIKLRQGVLFIQINSAPMCQELTMTKQKLIQKINHALGKEVVKNIILKP